MKDKLEYILYIIAVILLIISLVSGISEMIKYFTFVFVAVGVGIGYNRFLLHKRGIKLKEEEGERQKIEHQEKIRPYVSAEILTEKKTHSRRGNSKTLIEQVRNKIILTGDNTGARTKFIETKIIEDGKLVGGHQDKMTRIIHPNKTKICNILVNGNQIYDDTKIVNWIKNSRGKTGKTLELWVCVCYQGLNDDKYYNFRASYLIHSDRMDANGCQWEFNGEDCVPVTLIEGGPAKMIHKASTITVTVEEE